MSKSILIFDLDGTILSINSFPKWVIFMIKRGKLVLSLKALWVLFLRKSWIINHQTAKQKFQKLWHKYCDQQDTERFTKELQKYIRPSFENILKLDHEKVLSTAAAGEYAQAFGHALGFEHIITTSAHGELFTENVKDTKRDQTLDYLKEKEWDNHKRIFFTDHAEDLPLINESHVVFWFGKDEDCPNIKNGEAFPCVNLDKRQLLSLVSSHL